MGLLFSLRGDSLAPRYAVGGKAYSNFLGPGTLNHPPVIATLSDPSVFGGKAIDLRRDIGDTRSLVFPSRMNWVRGTRIFSVRLRVVPTWTGTSGLDMVVLRIGSLGANVNFGGLRLVMQDNGTLFVNAASSYDAGANIIQDTKTISAVSGVAMDLMLTCDGSRYYISAEGVELANAPVDSSAAQNIFDWGIAQSMILAVYPTSIYVNELSQWDTCEPHVYAPRTAFLPCADFDGTLIPALSDTRLGVASGLGTGLCAVPVAANTKHGVATDVSDIGTYRGADLWTSPTPSQLAIGVQLQSDSLTPNLTGTLDSVTNLIIGPTLIGQSDQAILKAKP